MNLEAIQGHKKSMSYHQWKPGATPSKMAGAEAYASNMKAFLWTQMSSSKVLPERCLKDQLTYVIDCVQETPGHSRHILDSVLPQAVPNSYISALPNWYLL